MFIFNSYNMGGSGAKPLATLTDISSGITDGASLWMKIKIWLMALFYGSIGAFIAGLINNVVVEKLSKIAGKKVTKMFKTVNIILFTMAGIAQSGAQGG